MHKLTTEETSERDLRTRFARGIAATSPEAHESVRAEIERAHGATPSKLVLLDLAHEHGVMARALIPADFAV